MEAFHSYKYYVVHLAKHGRALFDQSADEESVSQVEMNNFIKRWHPKLEQVMGLHCMGLAGEWDWIGIFGMDDLSSWVGFREELTRTFPGHITTFLSLPGISHTEFVSATTDVPHYQKLHGLGVLPGQAEFTQKESKQNSYRYHVVHLAKHGRALFDQSAEEESVSQVEMNNFIKRWRPKLEQIMGLHCMGLAGEWDWIGVFGMDDLSSWVGFREELTRTFPGHITAFLSLPGISHTEFVSATTDVPHYQKLRALGVLPGQAEFRQK